MIPAVKDRCLSLVLRIDVPKHEPVDDGRVLNAVVRGAALGKAAQVELFGILMTWLTVTAELNAGNILVGGLHVELDRAVPEAETFEGNGTAFENDSALWKAFVPDESHIGFVRIVRVLDGVPMIGGQGNFDGRGGMKGGYSDTEQERGGSKAIYGQDAIPI